MDIDITPLRAVQDLIPHAGPMLLIDQLEEVDHALKSGNVSCTLKPDKPYWDQQNCFRRHWLLEIMAQAAAALFSALDQEANQGSLQPGVLLSIRQWNLLGSPILITGDQLTIFVSIDGEFEAMRKAQMKLYREDVLLAESSMSFYQPPGSANL